MIVTGFYAETPRYIEYFQQIFNKVGLNSDDIEIVLYPSIAIGKTKHRILLVAEAVKNYNPVWYQGYIVLGCATLDEPWPKYIPKENYTWWPYAAWCNPPVTQEEIVEERNIRSKTPKTHFCGLVRAYNNGPERNIFIEMVSKYKRIDSAGKWKNNMPNGWVVPGRHYSKELRDFYSTCKFVIACENTQTPGYITEKFINPLRSGSVPIYWGCPKLNETKLVNPATYIDISTFPSLEDAIKHIEFIDNNDEAYQAMLNAPLLLSPLMSDKPLVDTLTKLKNDKDTDSGN